MKLGLSGLTLMLLLSTACSGDSTPDVDNAEALCGQWDKADAETKAATGAGYPETEALVALLPEKYEHDAALFFYPYGGDPGPDASGAAASEAGGRLEAFRRDVCGVGMPEGE